MTEGGSVCVRSLSSGLAEEAFLDVSGSFAVEVQLEAGQVTTFDSTRGIPKRLPGPNWPGPNTKSAVPPLIPETIVSIVSLALGVRMIRFGE